MKTTRGFIIWGAAILFLAAVAGCNKSSQSSMEQQTPAKPSVQGRWSGYENGSTEKLTLEFTGDRFAYWDSQTNEIGSGTFLVNDTVQPNQMDLTFEKIAAPEYVGKVGLAVFELQGDELKIAGAEPGTTLRPASVDGGEGVRVFAFKRE